MTEAILIESVEAAEELPEGSVVAVRGGTHPWGNPYLIFAQRRSDGSWVMTDCGSPDIITTENLVENYTSDPWCIELMHVPGYIPLHETDFNFGLASAVVINNLVELLNVKSAVQAIEMGTVGLPIYFEAQELLEIIYRAAEEYNIDEWKRAVNGRD